jgi:predicted O-methyltransferase YrrM
MILSTVVQLLPGPARNLALRWREQFSLGRVPPTPCDPGELSDLTPARLRDALTDARILFAGAWSAAETARFSITSKAGGVNPGDRRALYYLARHVRPRRVLEIGTHIGASTVHLAAALRANATEQGPAGDLTTVDVLDVNDPRMGVWKAHGSTLAPAEMVDRLGVRDSVHFVVRPSLEFLGEGGSRAFDLIFLDGDHSASTVYRELPAALARTARGGLVLLHDFFPGGQPLWRGEPVIRGPWLAVQRLRREGARFEVLALGELPWPTKLGGSITSLAVVVREPTAPS